VYNSDGQSLGFAAIFGRFKLAAAGGAAAGPAERPPSQAVAYRLGEAVQLVGYDLPARAAAGQPLSLALYWRATGAADRPYTVFVHVVGATTVAQADSQPVQGNYPTDLWAAGDRVADEHSVPLPADLPPGDYQVIVGLYSLETQARLPVLDAQGRPVADNQITLGTVHVGP
jgi:hypothetical protein